MNLKDVLKGKIPVKKLDELRTSFDIIGDVAVLEIPESLTKYGKKIAEAVMRVNKHVNIVCVKSGERGGDLRLREMKVLKSRKKSGKTETIHKEYGCYFFLDVKKAYFSPRESTERQRILGQAKDGETIMVMFAGVGPYPIIIAKKRDVKVYSIELNRKACEYMKENVKMNKVQDKVETICGDVRKKSKKYYGKCDRIIMPLPKEAYKFLSVAFSCLKKKGTIHMYHVSHESDLFSEPIRIIKNQAKKNRRKIRIIEKRKVLPYGPRTWKVCVDFEVY